MREKSNQKMMKNVKGITLIALVVTIIVLLILAGVSINIAFNTGIISKSKNATATYKEAEENEANKLAKLEEYLENNMKNEATATTVEGAIAEGKEGKYYDKNTTITDSSATPATVPAGFKIAADSATTVAGGVVIEDANGNQYVWIPVATINDYSRKAFKGEDITTTYTEDMPTDEQTSVTKNKGYYIGRYEAGDGVSTTAKTLRTSSTSTANAVTVKKGQVPYNWVTRDEAKTLAEGIKTANNYTGITASKLCSSYAWDTALQFIDATVSNYSTNSSQGNYYDQTFTYTDIDGNTQTKAKDTYTLIPTGETTAVCNIYDMGGNVWEWTTEFCSIEGNTCTFHGGDYGYISTDRPAGGRGFNTAQGSYDCVGFRVTLYL